MKRTVGSFSSLFAVGALALAGSGSTAAGPSSGLATSLRVDLANTATANGSVIAPGVGPTLTAVVRGRGAIRTRSRTGRFFLRGGQQNADTAFLQSTGPSAAALFSADSGSVTVTAVSRAALSARTTITGRNQVALTQLTTGVADGPSALAFGISLNFDAAPSVVATINGTTGSAPLSTEAFGPGRRYRISLSWSAGTAVLAIGGAEVARFTYPTTAPQWKSSARFAIGASADFGGGYFSAYQDAIERVDITRAYAIPASTAPASRTSSVVPGSTTVAAPTVPPATSRPTTTAASIAPTTVAPLTPTVAPSTVAPRTATVAPTTVAPTTVAPTTFARPTTTVAPTTVAPKAVAPTTTLLPGPGSYPAQWEWTPGWVEGQAASATSADGQPLIRQIRNGVVIATYTKLGGAACTPRPNSIDSPVVECGAFSRGNTYANKRDGDIFEVYPAVYEGADQQPWIGPMFENDAAYSASQFIRANRITIRGVTVNAKRPVLRLGAAGASNNTLGQGVVYVEAGNQITIENLDIDAGSAGTVGKAGIYLNGGSDVTIRDVAIHGFRRVRSNGLFSTSNSTGTLTLDRVQLFDNGGDSGPEHNAYINASTIDPNFTVRMLNSYSTGVYYGHLFKSRAQNTVLEGNYFRGTVPLPGEPIAESFLVEIPNGGRLTMRNNILVKNASGDGSNGGFVFYAAEGVPDSRPLSVLIEHNTFVAFARFYDSQQHAMWPMGFFYPQRTPGAPGFGVSDAVVRSNVFVGFVPQTSPGSEWMNFRGTDSVSVGFDALRRDFGLLEPVAAASAKIIGSPAYDHKTRIATRTSQTVGAKD